MAGGITAAAVWVDVIPSMKGAAKQISAQARTLGQQTGKGFADETSRTISQRASTLTSGLRSAFTRAQQTAAAAGQRVGQAFTSAARGGFQAASAALTRFTTGFRGVDSAAVASAGRLGRLGSAARTALDPAMRPMQNFVAGLRSSDAAASALTGRMGSLGGRARSALDGAARPVQNLVAGFRSSDAAASAFTGRLGSVGGAARSALTAAAAPVQNLVSGFRSSEAAASAFTGRMGTVGGAVRSAMTASVAPVQNLVAGFRSSDVAASAFSGRMGSLGGVIRSGLGTAVQPVNNLVAGFRSSSAAASAFSGRMGTVGGAVRTAMTSASGAMSNFAERVNTKAAESAATISNGIGGALTGLAARAGGLVAAVGLGALGASAVSAASNIQNTRLTLTGMYNSASDANDMMTRLSNLSQNSPIDYSAYAQASTQLAYMGIKGQDAEGVLRNVGAAITAAGGNSDSMGRATDAMLQMVNSGKVYAAQLNQISAAGVPVFSALASHFNTNIENVREMVTEGKVSIDDVMDSIKLAQGDTFQQMIRASAEVTGSMSNQWAIFKDNFVQGLGAMLLPLVTQYGPALGGLGKSVGDAMSRVPGILSQIGQSAAFQGIVAGLRAIWDFLQPVVAFLGQMALALAGPAFAAAATVLGWIGDALAVILPYLKPLQPIIVAVAAAFAAWWVIGAAVSGVVGALAMLKNGLTLVTTAWRLLSAAFIVSPIGFIVALIAGLVIGVIYAYTHFQWFRDIVAAAWAGIQAAASGTWNFLQTVFAALGTALSAVGGFFTGLWDTVVSVFNSVASFLATWGTTILAVLMPFVGIPLLVYQYWTPISAFFVTLWNGVVNFFTTVWTGIVNFFATVFGAIWSLITTVWSGITNYFTSLFNAHRELIMQVWGAISGFFTTIWTAIWTTAVVIWSAVSGFLASIWMGIRDTAISAWNAISAYFAAAFAYYQAMFAAVWNVVSSIFMTVWNFIRSTAISAWNAISGFFVSAFNYYVAMFTAVWNMVSSVFMTVWNFIRSTAISVWNAIVAFLMPGVNAFAAFFAAIWSGVSNFFATVWNGIRNTAVTVWGAISGFFASAFAAFTGFFTGAWNTVARVFADVWNGIKATAGNIWNGIVGVVKGAINGVIDAANWMTDKVNIVLKFLLIPLIPSIPRLEAGGVIGYQSGGVLPDTTQGVTYAASGARIGPGFVTSGPQVVVGEGRRSHPEYVVPTDPIYRSRALALHSSLSAELGMGTPAAGASPGGIAGLAGGGILGWLGDAASWVGKGVTGIAEKVGGALSDATQWMSGGIDGIVGQIKDAFNSIVPAGLFHGAGGWIVDKVVEAVKAKVMPADGGGEMVPVGAAGAGVQRWAGLVLRALAYKRQPASLLGTVLRRMNQESGGNPNIVNRWDSNAKKGTPSGGLMQTIMPTFLANHEPGTSFNMFDPWANILASMNYAIRRYGSLSAAYNKSGGYDKGGLATGRGLMLKDIIAPERVLPPGETQSYDTLTRLSRRLDAGIARVTIGGDDADATANGRSGGVHLHVHGDVNDPVDVDVLTSRLEFGTRSASF